MFCSSQQNVTQNVISNYRQDGHSALGHGWTMSFSPKLFGPKQSVRSHGSSTWFRFGNMHLSGEWNCAQIFCCIYRFCRKGICEFSSTWQTFTMQPCHGIASIRGWFLQWQPMWHHTMHRQWFGEHIDTTCIWLQLSLSVLFWMHRNYHYGLRCV